MIFVTGGTGMVGAHLLVELTRREESVRALKRKTSCLNQAKHIFSRFGEDENFKKIEWINGDICDLHQMEDHLTDVDVVFHSAAIVSFEKRKMNQMLINNREGTACLVDAALKKGVKKFCHVSSIASLGDSPDAVETTEEEVWSGDKNRSNYSKSKYLSEMEVWRAHSEGLDMVIVNPSVILGMGEWSHGSPKFFSTVAKGMKFYTKGGTGFVDVLDVVEAMIHLVDSKHWDRVKNERYILNGDNVRYKDLFHNIAERLDVAGPTFLASDLLLGLGWRLSVFLSNLTHRPALLTKESARSSNSIGLYSNQKIRDRIGFSFRTLDDTIARIANDFKKDQQ